MGSVRHERIVSDPEIMTGKPVVRGTRITVELLLDKLGRGMSMEELLAAYPYLSREDILAALRSPRIGCYWRTSSSAPRRQLEIPRRRVSGRPHARPTPGGRLRHRIRARPLPR